MRSELDILALFPSFESERFGGVQTSGREAWHGILGRIEEGRACALYYQAGGSKTKAVLQALGKRNTAKVVLVWHLHLLKLLPFLDSSTAQVVLFLHGIEAWLKQSSFTHRVLRKVDVFLSNSDHTWRRFLDYNPEFRSARHRTIHLGASCTVGGEIPVPLNPPAVLMIGRLSKSENYKGHQQMIEAWPQVLQRVPSAELWIAGDGDLRPSLEQDVRDKQVTNSVKFFGHISDARKEQLIKQCHCVALPSRGEGFGLVYLEAMRVGRPCLVSHLDAGREVVNPPEAGLAVDPGDPCEIADAIHRFLTLGPEWDQWSARARERYERNFTSEQFQQRLFSALFDT